MVGPPSGTSGTWGLWRGPLRMVRSVALVIYAGLTANGALLSPRSSLALGGLFAFTGAALVASLHRCAVDGLSPLPHPLVAGIGAGCLPAAVAGTTTLGARAGMVVGLGLVLGAVVGGHWIGSPPARSPVPPTPATDRVKDEQSLRQILRAVPTDVLCAEWRNTQAPGGALGSEFVVDIRMRDMLIDEMQRRDPAGTARWLSEGAGELPDGYIRERP